MRNEIYPAFAGEYFTWSKSRRSTSSPFDAYLQRGTNPASKLNAKGTQGYAGGTDGVRVAYQEALGLKSDIRLFDLATRRRSSPKGVNTKRWEWRPSISGGWLLFDRGMIFSSGLQQVLLKNLVTGELRVLDSLKSKNGGLQVGQVNGNYAVWMRCQAATCNVLRYDIAAATKTQIPASDKLQYSPSVSATGDDVFRAERPQLRRFGGAREGPSRRFGVGALRAACGEGLPEHLRNHHHGGRPPADRGRDDQGLLRYRKSASRPLRHLQHRRHGAGSAALLVLASDDHVLVELAGTAPGSPVHVPPVPRLDPQAGSLEDLGIEVAPVVDHDHDRGPRAQ